MKIIKIISESKDGLKREVITNDNKTRHIQKSGAKWFYCENQKTNTFLPLDD